VPAKKARQKPAYRKRRQPKPSSVYGRMICTVVPAHKLTDAGRFVFMLDAQGLNSFMAVKE